MITQIRAQIKKLFNPFRIRIFLFVSYSFGIETINTFIHSVVPSKTIPDVRPNAQRVYLFSDQNGAKTYLMRAAHTHLYGLYKGESPPPSGPWISSDRTWRGWSKDFFEFKFSIPGFFWVPAYPGRVVLRIKSTKHVFKNFAFRVISFNVFWKFLRLRNTAWNFFRG